MEKMISSKDHQLIMGRGKDIVSRLFPSFTIILYYLSLLVSWYTYKGPDEKEGYYIDSAQLSLIIIDNNILSFITPTLVAIGGFLIVLISLYFTSPIRRWKISPFFGLIISMTGTMIMASSILFALVFGYKVAHGIEGLQVHAMITIGIISIGIMGVLSFTVLFDIRTLIFTRSISGGKPRSFGRIPLIISAIISIAFPIIAIIYLPIGSGHLPGVGAQLCILFGAVFMGILIRITWKDHLTKKNIMDHSSMIQRGDLREASDLMIKMGCQHKAAGSQVRIGFHEEAANNFEANGFYEEAREVRSRWVWKEYSAYDHNSFELERPKGLIHPRAIMASIFIILSFFLLLFTLSQPIWLSWDYDEDVEPDSDDYRNYHIRYYKESGPFKSYISYGSWGIDENGNISSWVGYTYSDSDETEYNETLRFNTDTSNELPLCSIFLFALVPMIILIFLFIIPFLLVGLRIWSGEIPSVLGLIMAFLIIFILFIMTLAYSYEEWETWNIEYGNQFESYPHEVEVGIPLSVSIHPAFITLWVAPIFLLAGSILGMKMKPNRTYLEKARRNIYTLNLKEAEKYYSKVGMIKTSERIHRILDPAGVGPIKIPDPNIE